MRNPNPSSKMTKSFNRMQFFIFFMRSVFRYFRLWVQDLVIFELRFGFLMQNSIYGQMETLGIHQMGLRTLKIHFFFLISSTKNQFLDLQRAPRRSQEGLKSSGGPVRIICTKFRSISMVSERVMIENPSTSLLMFRNIYSDV